MTFVALEVARLHHGIVFVTDGSGHGTRCSISDLSFSGRGFDPSAAPLWQNVIDSEYWNTVPNAKRNVRVARVERAWGGSSVTFVALEVARLHHGILFVTDGSRHLSTSPGRLLIGPDLYSNLLHVELLCHCEPLYHMSVLLLSNPRHPHFMNHADIQWPDGAADGRLVPEFHDLWWLSNLI